MISRRQIPKYNGDAIKTSYHRNNCLETVMQKFLLTVLLRETFILITRFLTFFIRMLLPTKQKEWVWLAYTTEYSPLLSCWIDLTGEKGLEKTHYFGLDVVSDHVLLHKTSPKIPEHILWEESVVCLGSSNCYYNRRLFSQPHIPKTASNNFWHLQKSL